MFFPFYACEWNIPNIKAISTYLKASIHAAATSVHFCLFMFFFQRLQVFLYDMGNTHPITLTICLWIQCHLHIEQYSIVTYTVTAINYLKRLEKSVSSHPPECLINISVGSPMQGSITALFSFISFMQLVQILCPISWIKASCTKHLKVSPSVIN